ncbi:MAG: RagB/SusD family nutrient uptake outer membrane protein [Longimicrobiales bacterium]
MMLDKRHQLPAVLLVAVCVGMAGCSETDIQGVVLEEDLNDPDLMPALVRGVNSELTDAWALPRNNGGYLFEILSATDDFVNDRTDQDFINLTISAFHDREVEDAWNQSLEASWAGLRAVERMRLVFDEETFNTSPLVARAYIVSGMGERTLGDAYREGVFQFGPNGGFLLPGEQEFDNSQIVSRDSIFQRVATLFELGLGFAERALAAGVPTPDDDPLFDPQRLVYTAHGGAAQAYMAMASLGRNPAENWDLAVQHAREVPTDHVESIIHHEDVEDNAFRELTWDDEGEEATLWGALIDGQVFGTPALALWPDDPRVSVTHCGDFETPPTFADGDIQGEVVDNEVDDCDRFITETDTYPVWVSNKYDEDGSDIPFITGTEMRLIEAEAALVRGDLGEFTNQVNQVRAFHGADPILPPTTVGEFEWPNAEDDARSILDRERYLTLWLEGRRAFDLARWDHPWITEGHALTPRHRALLNGPRPFEAHPIPESECNINGELNCPVLSP